MSDKPFGSISCGTADCECHNTNMPANCERATKPNLSFCQKFTKEHPSEAKTMSGKPEKIFLRKLTHFDMLCSVWGRKRVRDTDVEYIRADLLVDLLVEVSLEGRVGGWLVGSPLDRKIESFLRVSNER